MEEADAEAGKQHENIKYKDDELRPTYPKDSKPPPEFFGARKDFMPWRESFTSLLRLRSSKWTRVIEWLKSKRENRLVDGHAKLEYLAYAQVNGTDKKKEDNSEVIVDLPKSFNDLK